MNKRDRPLPSGRISMCNALILRWSLVPLCCGLSALYSRAVFWTSVFIALTTILYNEGAVHGGQWLIRNVLLATGYSAFELGATLVAAKGTSLMSDTILHALTTSYCAVTSSTPARARPYGRVGCVPECRDICDNTAGTGFQGRTWRPRGRATHASHYLTLYRPLRDDCPYACLVRLPRHSVETRPCHAGSIPSALCLRRCALPHSHHDPRRPGLVLVVQRECRCVWLDTLWLILCPL